MRHTQEQMKEILVSELAQQFGGEVYEIKRLAKQQNGTWFFETVEDKGMMAIHGHTILAGWMSSNALNFLVLECTKDDLLSKIFDKKTVEKSKTFAGY